MRKDTIITLGLILAAVAVSYYIGKENGKNEIINRALEIKKDCYTPTELEVIIFGESQL